MEHLVKDFLKQKSFAVVGSFRNESKTAWRIVKTMKKKGYNVCPVNPRIKDVEGLVCYPSIKDISHVIDVVDIVTSPIITMKIVKDCKDKGVSRVWMQPGAESEEAIEFCHKNDISVIHDLCVMLEAL